MHNGFEKRQLSTDMARDGIPMFRTCQALNVLQTTAVVATFVESTLCTFVHSTDMY